MTSRWVELLGDVGVGGLLGKGGRGLDVLCSVALVVIRTVDTPALCPYSNGVNDFSTLLTEDRSIYSNAACNTL